MPNVSPALGTNSSGVGAKGVFNGRRMTWQGSRAAGACLVDSCGLNVVLSRCTGLGWRMQVRESLDGSLSSPDARDRPCNVKR